MTTEKNCLTSYQGRADGAVLGSTGGAKSDDKKGSPITVLLKTWALGEIPKGTLENLV